MDQKTETQDSSSPRMNKQINFISLAQPNIIYTPGCVYGWGILTPDNLKQFLKHLRENRRWLPLTIDSETVNQVVPCFLHKIMFIFYLTSDSAWVWELLQDWWLSWENITSPYVCCNYNSSYEELFCQRFTFFPQLLTFVENKALLKNMRKHSQIYKQIYLSALINI